jgi:hypothetical protein
MQAIAPASNAQAGRKGWYGPDMSRDTRWVYRFSGAEVSELDAALRTFRATGRKLEDMAREDFPLPTLKDKLTGWLHEMRNGRGFVVLRGLPVQDYSDEDSGAIFYGLGLYLGLPLRQNPKGDVLGHVYDQGRKFGQIDVRGSQSNAFLPFHTDGCELIGLMCLRAAKSGGLSSISNAVEIYREIERTRPELIEPLTQGYYYIRREAALTERPISEKLIPVYGEADGVVSCRFVPTQIEAALQSIAPALTPLQREALDEVVRLSHEERFRVDMDLLQGDIQLINNYTVFHSRTEYEDFPEPERRRHMLRLWLAFEQPWPLAPGFIRQLGYAQGQLVEKLA